MKRLAIALLALQVLVLPLAADEPAKACSLCVGALVSATPPPVVVPLLLETRIDALDSAAASLRSLSPAQRAKTTVVVAWPVDDSKEGVPQVEETVPKIVDWARTHGPFEAIGISAEGADATLAAYAIKRLAVLAQGLDAATQIVLPSQASERMQQLFDAGALAYVDVILARDSEVEALAAWLAERDPSKRVHAVVHPQAPNAFFDLARALAGGATRAYHAGAATAADLTALANLNAAFAGDYAYDATGKVTVLDARGNEVPMPVLLFVRGEDLRTIIVPRGEVAASSIVSLASDRFTRPRRIDATGDREVTDVGSRGGRFLIGFPPVRQPFALTIDRAERSFANVTRESLEIATRRGISVEEIIRNHQSYESYQDSIEPRFVALNTTKLRFALTGGEAVEATIAGDFFSDPQGRSDWVWRDFFINGVRWKYGRIPELPLIQPEKVTQLPLDIHLTNEYRYEFVRETDLLGYRVYEVRFEPPPDAPEHLPLYRGTVWIDTRTWARIRISMVQLNLSGEVLSNEERVDFQPFDRTTRTPLTPGEVAKSDPRAVLWLPQRVEAQQVISAAGRANVVLRATELSNVRLDPPDYDALLQAAHASDARMVRDTEQGLRYLEKKGDGERVVKEGYDTAQLFMLGGIHHDNGLEYPVVPLGGVDYFNFNLGNRGIQTNVFFAGVVVAANATHPNVGNTRTNVGADFFGIAVPVENTVYRNGEEQPRETVRSLPINLTLRAGHPFLQFGKVDVSLGLLHLTHQRAEETAKDFAVPSDTFVISPELELTWARRGYRFSASWGYSRRTTWEPWGNPDEYRDDQKSFTRFTAAAGKSFYLPKFQRIGVDVNYLDGQRLDRFSKYELGFFGSQRVHGIQSGSVRAEKAIIGHLSYGFVFSEQFRIEAFYDHALIDDAAAGHRREPFQGVGVAGQTVGPYGTLLRLDIGKSVGRNAQDGFVANVVFLKLF